MKITKIECKTFQPKDEVWYLFVMVNILICCVGNDIHKLLFELNILSKETNLGRKSVKIPTNKWWDLLLNILWIHAILEFIHKVNCHLAGFDP